MEMIYSGSDGSQRTTGKLMKTKKNIRLEPHGDKIKDIFIYELHAYKEVKNNKFNNVLNIQTDLKNNVLYKYVINNINNIP